MAEWKLFSRKLYKIENSNAVKTVEIINENKINRAKVTISNENFQMLIDCRIRFCTFPEGCPAARHSHFVMPALTPAGITSAMVSSY